MQEFLIAANERVSLAMLRKRHADKGFSGHCIVRFAPSLFSTMIDVVGFRHVDDYRFTKPVHPDEIGGTEVFHFVPDGSIDYTQMPIW